MKCRPFDREKLGTKEFFKEWKKLCDETPTQQATCARIRENQELFLEYQQKCLNQFDPTIQAAIEHAGDIIRELSKGGCKAWDLGYIGQKMRFLESRLDDLNKRKRTY